MVRCLSLFLTSILASLGWYKNHHFYFGISPLPHSFSPSFHSYIISVQKVLVSLPFFNFCPTQTLKSFTHWRIRIFYSLSTMIVSEIGTWWTTHGVPSHLLQRYCERGLYFRNCKLRELDKSKPACGTQYLQNEFIPVASDTGGTISNVEG